MWFLLGYLLGGRRTRRRQQQQPALAILGLTFAFVGVLVGGLWVGVIAATIGLLVAAAVTA